MPPVCVKSGRPAAGTWTCFFAPPGKFAIAGWKTTIRVRLPMTKSWLDGFTVLLALRTIGLAVAMPCYLVSYLLPQSTAPLRSIAFVALTVSAVAALVTQLEQPKGSVHTLPSGQRWVLLVGAHPAFVDAMTRSRSAQVAVFSADRKWWWSGSAWMNNLFPELWWRRYLGSPR